MKYLEPFAFCEGLFYGVPANFNLWGENFLRSLRVINQLSTAKTKASPVTPEAK